MPSDNSYYINRAQTMPKLEQHFTRQATPRHLATFVMYSIGVKKEGNHSISFPTHRPEKGWPLATNFILQLKEKKRL